MKEFIRKYYVYIIVIIAFYVATPLLCRDAGGAFFTLLVIFPLIILILSFIHSKTRGFNWWLSLIIGLLWIPVITIYLNESALIYALIYGMTSFLGQGLGVLFKGRK